MSSIVKRTSRNGKVSYGVLFRDQYGNRHEVSAGPLKKHAINLRDRILEEVNAGTYGRKNETFSEFCETFINIKSKELKPSTVEQYRSTIRSQLEPYFGKCSLQSITPSSVEGLLAHLNTKGVSPASQGKALRTLKVIMRTAVKLELINRDPCAVVRAPRVDRKEMNFLDPEEVQWLVTSSEGDARAFLAIACYSGLRLGESLALTWSSIDLEGGCIKVTRSWWKNDQFVTPKSKTSIRVVPVCRQLREELEALYEDKGKPEQDELLFFNDENGNRYDFAQKSIRQTIKDAGFEQVRIHDLRHTFASICIEGGVDPKTLQVIMGHSTITVTLNYYAHLYPAAYDRAVKGIEAILDGNPRVIQFPAKTTHS